MNQPIRFRVLVGVLVGTILMGWFSAAESQGWPSFRGNSDLTGVAVGTLPDSLSVLWTFEIEDSRVQCPVLTLSAEQHVQHSDEYGCPNPQWRGLLRTILFFQIASRSCEADQCG